MVNEIAGPSGNIVDERNEFGHQEISGKFRTQFQHGVSKKACNNFV
jgi:hypothetical protein